MSKAKRTRSPTLGENLAARAAGHWIGAQQLHAATPISPDDLSRAAPFWLLMGFSAEIALKAILLAQGVSADEIKSFGHNLWRLYRASTWPTSNDMADVEFVLKALRKVHAEHFMRYGTAQTFKVPDADLAVRVIQQLVDVAVRAHGMTATDPALIQIIEGPVVNRA